MMLGVMCGSDHLHLNNGDPRNASLHRWVSSRVSLTNDVANPIRHEPVFMCGRPCCFFDEALL